MSKTLCSREGCLRCLARRKKCDESRPICQNCKRLNLECVWRGDDQATAHVLSSTKSLGELYAYLRTRPGFCTFDTLHVAFTPQQCPRLAISNGYLPLRNNIEHDLLTSLSGFLSMLILSEKHRDHTHILRASLQDLCVRDALLSFSAYVSSARLRDSRALSYEYYHASVKTLKKKMNSTEPNTDADYLLVATLFLGLLEVNNPDNKVFPLLHFEAVGYILDQITKNFKSVDISTALFYRIALEVYLYHVAILSLFYPQTDRYMKLSTNVETKLCGQAADLETNVIISMDLRVYRVLFEAMQLARTYPHTTEQTERLRRLGASLANIQTRGIQNIATGQETEIFGRRTMAAAHALNILLLKIGKRELLPGDDVIKTELSAALDALKLCSPSRAWTGNFVWIITILLCAAHTPDAIAAVQTKIEELQGGIWGGDLTRLQMIVRLVQGQRRNSCTLAARSDHVIKQANHDTLALLLHPRGVLAI